MERKRRPNIHKKLLSALLALAMVAGVPAPAFAFDAAPVLPETGAAANANPETGGEQAAATPQATKPVAPAEPGAPIVIGPEAAQPAAPAEPDFSPAAVAIPPALLAAAAMAVILLRRSQRGR